MFKFIFGLYFLRRLFRKKPPKQTVIVIENKRGKASPRKKKRK